MSRLKSNLAFLGLDLRKEILWFLAFTLLFGGLFALLWFWRGFGFILLFPALGYAVFAFYFFTRYGAMVKGKLEALSREFVNLFTYFGIFIGDGFSVYNALERVKDYASEDFRTKLEKLLEDVDNDKTVTPFVTFASKFHDVAIREVMLSVYQMVDEGEGSLYLRQFQKLFGRLSDTRHALDAEKRLSRLDTMGFLPLMGSGIAMLALTMSIMEIMGGLTDVL